MKTLKEKTKKSASSLRKPSMADLALKAMTDEPNTEDFARVKAITDAELESFRALVQFGQGALRTSLLINGGATVALLSFFAATVSSVAAYSEHLKQALLTYGIGVFLGALASGFGYAQAYSNYNDNDQRSKIHFQICFSLIFLSYIVFLIGSILGFIGLPNGQL